MYTARKIVGGDPRCFGGRAELGEDRPAFIERMRAASSA